MIWFVLRHRGKAQPCSRLCWSMGEQRLQQCWGQLRGPHLGCELSLPPGTKKARCRSPFLWEEPKYLSNLGGKCCKIRAESSGPRDPTDAAICTSWVFISRRINAGAASGAARLPEPGSDGSVGGRSEGTPTGPWECVGLEWAPRGAAQCGVTPGLSPGGSHVIGGYLRVGVQPLPGCQASPEPSSQCPGSW